MISMRYSRFSEKKLWKNDSCSNIKTKNINTYGKVIGIATNVIRTIV